MPMALRKNESAITYLVKEEHIITSEGSSVIRVVRIMISSACTLSPFILTIPSIVSGNLSRSFLFGQVTPQHLKKAWRLGDPLLFLQPFGRLLFLKLGQYGYASPGHAK